MAKLTRVTSKIFGEDANPNIAGDPEISQFGSGLAETFIGTSNVDEIQSLPAWGKGWIQAVTPTQQFPALSEMTGAMKVLSYQSAYNQQMGIPEWDDSTDYYINSYVQVDGVIYKSLTDENIGNNPTEDTENWEKFSQDISWGSIEGNIDNQQDLKDKLNNKQDANLLPSWKKKSIAAPGVDLYAFAYGDNKFVALNRGRYYISRDNGETWGHSSYTDASSIIYDVVYGNGKFVAVGTNGACFYYTGSGGWAKITTPVTTTLYGITYGDGKFVAVGVNGVCIVSTNGINWEVKTTGVTATLFDVAYGYNSTVDMKTFLAVGEDGTVVYSHDLDSWNTVYLEEDLSGVAYGNNKFVAVGFHGACYYSTISGDNWNKATTLWSNDATIVEQKVVGSDKGFVIMPTVPANRSHIVCYSQDGVNWIASSLGITTILLGMAYGDGKFVSISSDVDASFVFTSELKSYSTIISSSTKHILFSNGTLLQWGKETRSGATQRVIMPYPYVNTDYAIMIQPFHTAASTDGRPPLVYESNNKTVNSFYANLYTSYAGFYWFTIGQGVIYNE